MYSVLYPDGLCRPLCTATLIQVHIYSNRTVIYVVNVIVSLSHTGGGSWVTSQSPFCAGQTSQVHYNTLCKFLWWVFVMYCIWTLWLFHITVICRPNNQTLPYDFTHIVKATKLSCEVTQNERALLAFLLAKINKMDPDIIVVRVFVWLLLVYTYFVD